MADQLDTRIDAHPGEVEPGASVTDDLVSVAALQGEETLAEYVERGLRTNRVILRVVLALLVVVIALTASLLVYLRDTSTGVPLTRAQRDVVAATAFRDSNRSVPDAWSALAIALEVEGRIDAAIETIDHGILETGDSLLLSTQGDIFRRARRYEQAISAYTRALAYFEQSQSSRPTLDADQSLYLGALHHGRGVALIATGDVAEGVVDLERSVEYAPRLADAWVALGDGYLLASRDSEALEAYLTALRFVPDHAAALQGVERAGGGGR